MKVLHVVLTLDVGGLENFIASLVAEYSGCVESLIVCLETNGAVGEMMAGVRIIELNKNKGLRFSLAVAISQIAKINKIDIIHTHNQLAHLYGSLGGFLSRIPVVHTKHGRNAPHSLKKSFLSKISSMFTTKIVAVSSDAADVCKRIEYVSSTKIMTILNGIDTHRFTPGKSGYIVNELSIPQSVPLIGIVARLSIEKDHATLISACRLLKERGRSFCLVIIGDGPLRNTLKEKVNHLHLDEYIHFMGMRYDIPILMRDLDIFVLSSITEGISLTLLEAMSCSIPVVATEVGGNPEVVIDCETGYLVPARNPELLAEKIEDLLENLTLRNRMGQAGRERVIETFSLSRAADQYFSLYQEILNEL